MSDMTTFTSRPTRRFSRRMVVWVATMSVLFTGLPGIGTAAFAAALSGDIDQCANGKFGTARTDCDWVNGNLNPQHSQYTEDETVAFRSHLGGLTKDTEYSYFIAWDTIDGGNVAYDYLTGWDCTEDGDPTAGTAFAGQLLTPSATAPIPTEPRVAAKINGGAALDGQCGSSGSFLMWGATDITLSSYTYSDGGTAATDLPTSGSMQTFLTISFKATGSDALLAWGGHIASRADWAPHTTAIADTSGSPYHMRQQGIAVKGGSPDGNKAQDRSLKGVSPEPDLSLVKSASSTSLAPGDTFTYTLTATNNGYGAAETVTIHDDLDDTFTNVSVDPAANCAVSAGNVVDCAFTSIAAAASQVITITATVPSLLGVCKSYDNTASMDAANNDPKTSNTVTVTVAGCLPDLSIAKSASSAKIDLGDPISYDIVVTNAASALAPALNVVVSDDVDTKFTVTDVTTTAGTCAAPSQKVSCTITTLAPGASATVTVTATESGNVCGDVDNVASAIATNHTEVTSDKVTVEVDGCSPDLSIAKTPASQSVALGGEITWTLTVTNAANATQSATNVVVTDTVTGATVTSVTPSAGKCSSTTNDISCEVGDLAAGASATVTIKADAPADSCADIPNVGSAVAGNHGLVSSSPAKVTVTGCAPDLSLVKTPDTQSAALGGPVSWGLTVTNSDKATSAATNVVVTDTVDTAFTNVDASSTDMACTTVGQVVTCTLDTLAIGDSAVVTITANAPATANSCDLYGNVGAASADGVREFPSNNVGIDVTGCDPQLEITKTNDTGNVAPGGQATFTLTVSNSGMGDAFGVVVVDEPPAGFTIVSMTPDNGTCTVATGECTVDVVAQGSTAIEVVLEAPSGNQACGEYTNYGAVPQRELEDSAGINVICVPPPPPPPPAQPSISLVKTGSTTFAQIGDVVTYTYEITNTGDVTLVDVTLADVVSSGVGVANLDLLTIADGITLAPGASTTVTSTWTATEGDIPTIANVATTTGRNGSTTVTDTDDWSVRVISGPGIDVVKTSDVDFIAFKEGEDRFVNYSYVVTNIGNVTLTGVTLVDDILGPITLATTTLAPGESTTGSASHLVTRADVDAGLIANVATGTGFAPNGEPVTDDDTVTVDVTEVLGVIIEQPDPAPLPQVEPIQEELPATGTDIFTAGGFALAMIGVGGVMLFARRPRARWELAWTRTTGMR